MKYILNIKLVYFIFVKNFINFRIKSKKIKCIRIKENSKKESIIYLEFKENII